MPELAEVEFYRKQWNPGLGHRVVEVRLHPRARVFRDADPEAIRRDLVPRRLDQSEAHGKRLCFHFSGGIWLGLHLGMTGQLSACGPDYQPGRHDHLVLRQKARALVFTDPRQFGRIQFHRGSKEPAWWRGLAPSLLSRGFTVRHMMTFLERHPKLPVKAALLSQDGFPGVGNWMADEILWRVSLPPATPCGLMEKARMPALWRAVRSVCRGALRTVGQDWSDPPKGWLFHERWSLSGRCPRHRLPLRRETIGGRTTAWCPLCQR